MNRIYHIFGAVVLLTWTTTFAGYCVFVRAADIPMVVARELVLGGIHNRQPRFTAVVQLDLEAPGHMTSTLAAVTLPKGKIDRLVVSPDNRHCFLMLGGGRVKSSVLQSDNLVATFHVIDPMAYRHVIPDVTFKLPVFYYPGGGVTVGAPPVPTISRHPLAVADAFDNRGKPVRINSPSPVRIITPEQNRAMPLGFGFELTARTADERRWTLVQYVRSRTTSGSLVAARRDRDGHGMAFTFYWLPYNKMGRMTMGKTHLDFEFQVQEHGRMRNITTQATAFIYANGCASFRRSSRQGAPIKVQPPYGAWRRIAVQSDP